MNAAATLRERGFALLAVLLIVGLIALFGATYGRHVVLAQRSSSVASTTLRAGGSLDSGLQYARQLLRTGERSAQLALTAGSTTALELSELDAEHSRIRLSAVDSSGVGATLLVEIERRPSVLAQQPDELPRLRSEAVAALLADASLPKTWINGLTTIEDTELEGLLVIEAGAVLSLSDVRLRGCVVSERSLTGLQFGPYDVSAAPTLLVAGDLRITPCFQLPGITVAMPDGVVTVIAAAPRLQLDGDVVAHTLILDGSGALRGQAASVAPPFIGPAIARPGGGRGPRDWAADLQLPVCAEFASLAVVPQARTLAELGAITGFDFDAR